METALILGMFWWDFGMEINRGDLGEGFGGGGREGAGKKGVVEGVGLAATWSWWWSCSRCGTPGVDWFDSPGRFVLIFHDPARLFVSAFLTPELQSANNVRKKLKSAQSGTQSRVPDFMPNIASSNQILQTEHIKGNLRPPLIMLNDRGPR
jgi:hypothetical protein